MAEEKSPDLLKNLLSLFCAFHQAEMCYGGSGGRNTDNNSGGSGIPNTTNKNIQYKLVIKEFLLGEEKDWGEKILFFSEGYAPFAYLAAIHTTPKPSANLMQMKHVEVFLLCSGEEFPLYQGPLHASVSYFLRALMLAGNIKLISVKNTKKFLVQFLIQTSTTWVEFMAGSFSGNETPEVQRKFLTDETIQGFFDNLGIM